VGGEYRDVILPMTVIRRLDAVLEPTKQAVLAMKQRVDGVGITNQDVALRQASGQAFYNLGRKDQEGDLGVRVVEVPGVQVERYRVGQGMRNRDSNLHGYGLAISIVTPVESLAELMVSR
jgi:HsdM N-terminal domain